MLKSERLLAITLLLQSRGKMTAGRLANILDVSIRTIYRDIDSLSLAHVPVSMDHGPGGGYFLPPDFSMDPTTFTGEEAIALALGGSVASSVHLFEGTDGLRRALVKLEALLPEEFRADIQAARDRVVLDTADWYHRTVRSPYLDAVRRAVWQGHQMDLCYQTVDSSSPQWRRVEPCGLVFKAGEWYLVAHCRLRADFRIFRLSRIHDLVMREDPVTPRPDFNLHIYWEQSRQRFEEMTAPLSITLRVSPNTRRRIAAECTVLEERADGSAVVRVSLDSLDYGVSYALACGPGATVLDPPEVRSAVADAARAMARNYARQPAGDNRA